MRPRLDDAGDDEALELGAWVLNAFNFEADARQRLDDLGEARGGVEMVLQPGEGELHAYLPFPYRTRQPNSGKSGRRNRQLAIQQDYRFEPQRDRRIGASLRP